MKNTLNGEKSIETKHVSVNDGQHENLFYPLFLS